MGSILRIRIPLLILLLSISLFAFVLMYYPSASAINYSDVVIEGVMAFSCLFLIFNTETLKQSREIYRILLVSSTLLFIGHFLDVIDEFTVTLSLLDILEDIFKPTGFLLLLLGSYRWVDFHKKQCQMMRHLAERDPLTGLLNRRAFTNKAQSLVQRKGQATKQISIIIFDIDHFKQVNDNHGHLLGDHVLTKVATTVNSTLRKTDSIARLGGEEFVILLDDTDSKDATLIAEKIRTNIEKMAITHNQQEVRCTISLGVVSNYAEGVEIDTLIERADILLYEAKAAGRNCWRVAE